MKTYIIIIFRVFQLKNALIFFLLFLCPTEMYARLFEKIPITKSIGNMNLNSICQDKRGTIWIASSSGLYSYNGFQLVPFIPQERDDIDYPHNVRSIVYEERSNRLFFLQSNFLTCLDLNTERICKFDREYNAIALGANALWMADGNRIYRLDEELTIQFFIDVNGVSSITSIFENEGLLYLGTPSEGLYVIDIERKTQEKKVSERNITNFYKDSDNHIWVCSDGEGLLEILPNKNIIYHSTDSDSPIKLSSNYVRNVVEDQDNLYIGTNDGINVCNKHARKVHYYGAPEDYESGLPGVSVWSMIKDKQGTLWIGTYTGDIYILNRKNDIYKPLITSEHTNGREPFMGIIVQDKHNKLWIASEWNGLFSYSLTTNRITQYKYSILKMGSDNISSIYYDEKEDCVWTGSYLAGICRVDAKSGHMERIESKEYPQLSKSTISCFAKINNQVCFISNEGIFAYSYQNNSIRLLHSSLVNHFSQFCVQDEHTLWIADYTYLIRFDLRTGNSRKYPLIKNRQNGFLRATINQMYYDESMGKILLSSRGFGLLCFDVKTEEMERYTDRNSGLLGNVSYAIKPLSAGIYLIATNNGLSLFDCYNNHFSAYTQENGFVLSSMTPGGIFQDHKRDIYLSGKEGLFLVDKSNMFSQDEPFDVWFTELWVNYKKVYPYDNSGILRQALSKTTEIELKHTQNILSFRFSTNNYIKTNNIIYEYQLVGFDKRWMPLGAEKEINYMNLSRGRYELRLRAYNQLLSDNKKEIGLTIIVKPHPLLSWWAIVVYVCIATFILYWIRRISRVRMQMKNSIYLAHQEKKQMEIINQSKLRFFTNIAHEFKTPITLIIGQLQLILESNVIPPVVTKQFFSIYRQTLQLQELVTELVDFRKQEQGYLVLNISEESLHKFIEEIFLSFKEQAKIKCIDLCYENNACDALVWFDVLQLKKVINNVVLNALKYTRKDGRVIIRTRIDEASFAVIVEDTGIGISKDQIKRIFDRFYRVEQLSEEIGSYSGSGIGLAFSKSIVEAHGGIISVESEIGVGSTVTINIPYDFSELEKVGKIKRTVRKDPNIRSISHLVEAQKSFDPVKIKQTFSGLNDSMTVLIVEDHEELRNLLQQIFSEFSHTLCASNGEEGLEMLVNHQPDIVISDLLMPVLSGIELCERIKKSPEWCHTPIILLTACTSPEQNIEGLKVGADDYIAKPFDINILLTRCMNILLNRQLLKQKFSKEIDMRPVTITSNIIDQQFIERAFDVIGKNIGDEQFSIPCLAKELLVSQSTLTTKIKALTGQTPVDFVLTVKFRKAAELLLKMPEEKIVVIANQVGFSNSKYFASCFKERFGLTPSEYRKKNAIIS